MCLYELCVGSTGLEIAFIFYMCVSWLVSGVRYLLTLIIHIGEIVHDYAVNKEATPVNTVYDACC